MGSHNASFVWKNAVVNWALDFFDTPTWRDTTGSGLCRVVFEV